jgi:F-type H+-transporting ATPase subunit gamma
MKMVAAAKLKRATDRRAWQSALCTPPWPIWCVNAWRQVNAADWPILRSAGADEYPLYVVIGGERGLCGAFNNNLLREVRRTFRRHRAPQPTLANPVFGQKAL